MGSTTNKVIGFVVIYAFNAAWIICQAVQGGAIREADGGLVWGGLDKPLFYSYLSVVCLAVIIAVLVRALAVKFAASNDSWLVFGIACSTSLLICELPIAVLDYLVVQCKNSFLLDIQIAAGSLHIVSVLVQLAPIYYLINELRKGKKSTSKLLIPVFLLLILGGTVGVICLRALSLKGHTRVADLNPELQSKVIVYLRTSDLPTSEDIITDYPLGANFSPHGLSIDNFTVASSLENIVESTDVRERNVDSRWLPETSESWYFSILLCREFSPPYVPPVCSGYPNDVIQFAFRYDIEGSSLAPYGKLLFDCARRNNVTGACDEDCSPSRDGWQLMLLHVTPSRDAIGRDTSLVSTPWQELQECGGTSVQHAELELCSS